MEKQPPFRRPCEPLMEPVSAFWVRSFAFRRQLLGICDSDLAVQIGREAHCHFSVRARNGHQRRELPNDRNGVGSSQTAARPIPAGGPHDLPEPAVRGAGRPLLLFAEGFDHPNPKVFGRIDGLAIRQNLSVGLPQSQSASPSALYADLVSNELRRWRDVATKSDLTHADGPPFTRRTRPAQPIANDLPHGIQTKATRHHWVIHEVAFEEPKVARDVQLGGNVAIAWTLTTPCRCPRPLKSDLRDFAGNHVSCRRSAPFRLFVSSGQRPKSRRSPPSPTVRSVERFIPSVGVRPNQERR